MFPLKFVASVSQTLLLVHLISLCGFQNFIVLSVKKEQRNRNLTVFFNLYLDALYWLIKHETATYC